MLSFKILNNDREVQIIPVQSTELTSKGTLQVQAVLAQGGFPIENATVTIYNEIEPYNVIKVLKTDKSGSTETLTLPAPPKEYSFHPDCDKIPYSTYSIQVDYNGFYTNVYKNVQVFPDNLTINTANMIPLPKNMEGVNTMKVYVIPPRACVKK